MSSNYQNYGTQIPTYPAHESQSHGYLQQNTGFNPAYGHHSEEYLRQPATAPTYPSLQPPPVILQPQPQPQPVLVQPPQPEPQVYIVHHNNTSSDDDCCASLCNTCCECCVFTVARICWTVVIVIAVFIVIGLLVYFLKYFRSHH